jgi:hypothetical protein
LFLPFKIPILVILRVIAGVFLGGSASGGFACVLSLAGAVLGVLISSLAQFIRQGRENAPPQARTAAKAVQNSVPSTLSTPNSMNDLFEYWQLLLDPGLFWLGLGCCTCRYAPGRA